MNKRLIRLAGVFLVPFALFFLFMLLSDGFGFHSIPILLSQSMIPTVIGFAMAPIMQTGLMDFSIGARVVFGSVIGAVCAYSFGIAGFFIGCLVGSLAIAFMLAMVYRLTKIPSLVVSFAMLMLTEVAAYWIADVIGNSYIVKIPESIYSIGSYPFNLIFAIGAGIIFYLLMYNTKIGSLIKAVGNDEVLVMNMGVNSKNVKMKAFLLSGLFGSVCSVILICYSGTVAVQTGMVTINMVFKPMMGVMIGLTLLRLCDNIPLMILIGELCICTIFNGLIALGVNDNFQSILLGVFLLLVLGISGNADKMREAARKRATRRLQTSLLPKAQKNHG